MRVPKVASLIAAGIVIGSLLSAAPSGATVIKPTVTGFSSSATTLYKTGGTITLSATVTNATSCVFSSNKTITGMPYTATPCNGLTSHDVTVPANTGKKSVKYTFKLSAIGARTVNAKPVVTVTVTTQMPPGVTAIAAGANHTCALLTGGTVQCWGYNVNGQLGNGTNTGPETCNGYPCSTTPVTVSGLSGVTAITAGGGHTCALLSGGTVKCWGLNDFGQLGDGTTTDSNVPVTVAGLSGVTAITAANHTCALMSDGTVECWGSGDYGQLGNGTNTGPQTCNAHYPMPCSTTPVTVSGLSGVTAIAAGGDHNCALMSGGTVKCWGWNQFGELGDGTNAGPGCGGYCSTPVTVSGLSGVTAIAAAYFRTCALTSGGTVECWGNNDYGELGNGTTTDSNVPVTVAGLSGVTAISTGPFHACSLKSDGTVNCWGRNEYGQLGNGTNAGPQTCNAYYPLPCSTTPVPVSGLSSVATIAAGYYHTCVLPSDGTVQCWGRNDFGQLGNGTTTDSNVPVTVSGL